jgi:hypothetical protein
VSCLRFTKIWNVTCFLNTFLIFAIRFFPHSLAEVSNKHGGWFFQDMSRVEKWYQGKWNQMYLQIIAGHLSGNIRVSVTNINHEGTSFEC